MKTKISRRTVRICAVSAFALTLIIMYILAIGAVYGSYPGIVG